MFHIETQSAQKSLNIYRHKMDKSSSILFGLPCTDTIKYFNQFSIMLLMNFKNVIFQKLRKNLPLSKFQVFGVFWSGLSQFVITCSYIG